MAIKKDILNRADIEKLLAIFYQKLLKDDEFKHIFLEVARIDILKHLDITTDFWESVLWQSGKYNRNLVDIHIDLNQKSHYGLKETHFNYWLQVFNESVDQHFEGENSNKVKERALSIAIIMKIKIDNLEKMRLEISN